MSGPDDETFMDLLNFVNRQVARWSELAKQGERIRPDLYDMQVSYKKNKQIFVRAGRAQMGPGTYPVVEVTFSSPDEAYIHEGSYGPAGTWRISTRDAKSHLARTILGYMKE